MARRNDSENNGWYLGTSPNEHGPTMIIDRQLSYHELSHLNQQISDPGSPLIPRGVGGMNRGSTRNNSRTSLASTAEETTDTGDPNNTGKEGGGRGGTASPRYGSLVDLESGGDHIKARTIRFQVVVWHVGAIDVVQGRVPMKFRVTMFWNDCDDSSSSSSESGKGVGGGGGCGGAPGGSSNSSVGSNNTSNSRRISSWKMEGRQRALLKTYSSMSSDRLVHSVDVPPVSILNVVTFDIIGNPEVQMLRSDTKLMRWTCLYKAVLIMDDMRVDDFPHDEHEVYIKLGVLAHRRAERRWDSRTWKLALATENDSQQSTRVPYGLIVDNTRIPEFGFNKDKGLEFNFVKLHYGAGGKDEEDGEDDACLMVKLTVLRDSGYYDLNIMPVLCMLNTAATLCIFLPSSHFFQRALMLLNITFCELGIRTTVDKHLPMVGYQIRMQRILNEFFCAVLFMVLESAQVYILWKKHGWSIQRTDVIDQVTRFVALGHVVYRTVKFYWGRHKAVRKLKSK